jgi:hypothetical protein
VLGRFPPSHPISCTLFAAERKREFQNFALGKNFLRAKVPHICAADVETEM